MILEQIAFALAGVAVVLLLIIISLYTASKTVDRLTKELDEWDEIRKGNLATAIYFVGALLSVGLIISPSIVGLYLQISKISAQNLVMMSLVTPVIRLLLALIIAIVAQYVGLRAFTRMTKGIDEWAELRRGNTAVGTIMAGTLIVVGLITVQVLDDFLHLISIVP
ncbi:MAG: DUF350 domain-containing protein [Candidatus Bathyarchaeia archaeon]